MHAGNGMIADARVMTTTAMTTTRKRGGSG
jgi:hypothetical protein